MISLESKESKLYKALDKIEAVIQHNESPIETWSQNEYQLNKTYGVDEVSFSEWMVKLRAEVLDETIKKIDDSKKLSE